MNAPTPLSAFAPRQVPTVEAVAMTKRFGALTALDDVSVRFTPGEVHALLGENGAGKSTLVKCIMGYYRPDSGRLLVDGTPRDIAGPRDAHALGLGLVYQHFTLVPHMTVAENLVLGKDRLPPAVNWAREFADIESFLSTTPFRLALDRPVATLAAGEKQKLEILKQLFLGRRVLILDEPTSVLTPAEADAILSTLHAMAHDGALSVILITHKLREVERYADAVTILRGGRVAGGGPVAALNGRDLSNLMFGARDIGLRARRSDAPPGEVYLEVAGVSALNDRGAPALVDATLAVRRGEILGLAGVSGNGQRELIEILAGQRAPTSGSVRVGGETYAARRREMRRHGVFVLTEEPLRNACVRSMSLAENLALRSFDRPPEAVRGWFVRRGPMRRRAEALIERFRIKAPGPDVRIDTLSGGNVQRAVLARELSGKVRLLVAQNPCFGLDAAATAEIRSRILEARNAGAAVLLVSEDLDELLELADRVAVMFEGRIVYETRAETADPLEIGRHMVGRGEERA
jgi:simple sugar transport system ATP-binding protein